MLSINLARRRLLAASMLAGVPRLAWGQSRPIPPADFFRFPDIANVLLAPGGKSLLATRMVKGRRNLLVVELSRRKPTIITDFQGEDVVAASWINPDWIVFQVADLNTGSGDQQSIGRLLTIQRDASGFRELAGPSIPTASKLANARLHARIREKGLLTEDVFVTSYSMQSMGSFADNLYRLNVRSGRAAPAALGGPSNVQLWVVDYYNVPRAALAQAEGISTLHVRDSADAPWRAVARYGVNEPEKELTPLGFDKDGTLYLSAYQGRDLAGIYRFDWKAGAPEAEPLFSVKGFDLTGGLRFDDEGVLIGVDYEGERPGTFWIDKTWDGFQAQIDQALPDRINRLAGSLLDKGAPILVASSADTEPGRYYLFQPEKRQLEQVATSRPWIDTQRLAKTTFYRYSARDGLSIPALLTLPRDGAGKNLPLVVMHYGGPWVRAIHWGFDPAVQFLASRGYAVLMPAPRASTGFGRKHFRAGWKQWGLAMQDDVTDGARDLIARGIVDAKRVCIAGASYGGYLAMMGLVKEPALFRCGVNWVGVTDPEYMFSVTWTDFNRVDAARFSMPLLVGDPSKDAEQFRQTSPVRRAKEIKQPVLMAYGGLDKRVPIENGERLRAALQPHNPNVEWVVYGDEGHGFLKVENQVDFWGRVESFLAKNLAETK